MSPDNHGTRAAEVTLDNCASEPIHIPGAIQPHGVLLAFDVGQRLVAWSANTQAMLGFEPAGGSLSELPMGSQALAVVAATVNEAGTSSSAPASADLEMNGQPFDVVAHRHQGRLIVEFERRAQRADEITTFALKAHRSIERLRRESDLSVLLGHAVREVRALTGFDRVMAYRFRHDLSGEVAAEARRDDLEPFLGLRYPASDIPAQARRLYTLNTLRMIADIGYAPVPVIEPPGQAPVDMSFAVLRSVSPIHVEYLRNMGVKASMSVSIVVQGELWGLIACHHMRPLQVPYSIRMACDVLAQVLASSVQAISARAAAQQADEGNALLTEVVSTVTVGEDVLQSLQQRAPVLRALLQADALVMSEQGKLLVEGDLPGSLAGLATEITQDEDRILHWSSAREWPPAAAALPTAGWTGLLALPYDRSTRGVLIALRREQIEHVRWGGKPDKALVLGPNGARLTPRGSFAEWQETVRGRSEPWNSMQLQLAHRLHAELQRSCNARHAETDRARRQLIAMLGHDLRDPLQSINMVAGALKISGQQDRLTSRLLSSSNRMQRLITQVLDMSRLDAGMSLTARFQSVDLVALVLDLVEEARTGHPGLQFELRLPPSLVVEADGDRIGQLVGNLLSNARHYGQANEAIQVSLQAHPDTAVLRVANAAPPIPAERVEHLFSPFRGRDERSLRNRSGLGLGLFIACKIAHEHGGTLDYAYEASRVCFYARLPRPESAAGASS